MSCNRHRFRSRIPNSARCTTEGQTIRALTFWVGGNSPRILRPVLPLEEVAPVLARACGHRGSCAEYLYNTVVHLAEFGIRDRNLWRLQDMVAKEIRALHETPG
jgi:cation transport protein ChaC